MVGAGGGASGNTNSRPRERESLRRVGTHHYCRRATEAGHLPADATGLLDVRRFLALARGLRSRSTRCCPSTGGGAAFRCPRASDRVRRHTTRSKTYLWNKASARAESCRSTWGPRGSSFKFAKTLSVDWKPNVHRADGAVVVEEDAAEDAVADSEAAEEEEFPKLHKRFQATPFRSRN